MLWTLHLSNAFIIQESLGCASDIHFPILPSSVEKKHFEQYWTWLVNPEIRHDAVLTNTLK